MAGQIFIFRFHTFARRSKCQAQMDNAPPSDDVDRLLRVLAGALRLWQVAGSVTAEADEPRSFLISSDAGVRIAVHHDAAAGWSIALQDAGSGARMPIGVH